MDKAKNPAVSPDSFDSGRLTDSHERAWQIEAELVGLLYKQAPTGFVATILNACIAAVVLWPAVAPSLLVAWVAAIGTITLARFVLVRRYQHIVPAADQTRYWRTLFILGAASAGTAWGAAGVFLFPPKSIVGQVFLAFILGGMAAGAVVALAPVITAFLAFFLPTLLPITVRLFFQGGVIVCRDVTDRKQMEEALRQSEARLRQLLDTLPVGIFAADATAKPVYVNLTAQQLLGRDAESDTTLEQLAGRYNVFLAGTDQPYPVERMPLPRALSGQVTTVNDMELRQGGQVIPLQVTGAPVFDAAGRMESAIVTFSDISELKRVDRLKNEFISTVSHQLRTPLTSIHGSLRLIAGGVTGNLPVQAKAFVEIASKNCERLIYLINDILDIEKIESGRIVFHNAPVELLMVVEQALEANRAYGEQYGVHFVRRGHTSLPAHDGQTQEVLL